MTNVGMFWVPDGPEVDAGGLVLVRGTGTREGPYARSFLLLRGGQAPGGLGLLPDGEVAFGLATLQRLMFSICAERKPEGDMSVQTAMKDSKVP